MLYLAERWQDVFEMLDTLASESPRNVNYAGWLALAAARVGNRQLAQRICDEIAEIDLPYGKTSRTGWRARIATGMDQPELA